MRDSKELAELEGMKYLASAPKGEIIKNMVVHGDTLFVSTDKHIYTLEDNRHLKRLELTEFQG